MIVDRPSPTLVIFDALGASRVVLVFCCNPFGACASYEGRIKNTRRPAPLTIIVTTLFEDCGKVGVVVKASSTTVLSALGHYQRPEKGPNAEILERRADRPCV